ncbi:MAG: PIN domain-containing protein [Rhizobium sp.]|nr:PIN domain-containing protein [Rhizobium sp.]
MIVVDTNFLVLLIDPESTQNVNREADRVRHFIEVLSETREEVMIPAPSLAELVAGRAQRVEEIVEAVRRLKSFTVQAFDPVIAIETGERISGAMEKIPLSQRSANWKVAMKYDAMIAATAIVRGARALYTTDHGFEKYLEGTDVEICLVRDLPLPPEDPQQSLGF